MTLFDSLSDFIDLYLSIDLSKKEIELIKVRSYSPLKADDELKQTVDSFRRAISFIRKHHLKFRAKSHYGLPDQLENLLHLSPDEFLILIAPARYGFNHEQLSLILKLPVETIQFKSQHLLSKIPLLPTDLKEIHLQLQPLETKRFSQLQKIKSRFRPQHFVLETAVIMIAIIVALWSIPALRNRYEKWTQKKTSEYFVSGAIKEAPIPRELDNPPTVIETDTSAEAPAESEPPRADRKQPRAQEAEIWRFSFTGSAKLDLEKELKKILEKYSVESPKSSIAPGGIQYDAFVKVSELIALKMDFEGMTDSQSNTLKMSWYKKKSMGTKKIPSAHVEVIVWISTI